VLRNLFNGIRETPRLKTVNDKSRNSQNNDSAYNSKEKK